MTKQNMFHSASLKLAAVYTSIILVISLVFTFWLYNVTLSEIRQSVLRAPGPVEQLLRRENRRFAQELSEIQEQAIEDARGNIIYQFIVLNTVIAFSGALGGYYLARKTLKPIEEVHEAQSRFTADASHELRTPITAMRTETELSLTDKKLTLQKAKQQLQSNLEELDKLTALSDGLLQLARLDSNGLEKQAVDVITLIQQAVDRVLKSAEKKKQIINTHKVKSATVHVNQSAILEAIVTLLDNAIKFSPERSEIIIATKSQLKSIELAVSDNGIGINSSDLPYVFNRFYQADISRTNSAQHGYGIGLSIAKSVVEAHGGTILVKSKPGKGSTFIISLPL